MFARSLTVKARSKIQRSRSRPSASCLCLCLCLCLFVCLSVCLFLGRCLDLGWVRLSSSGISLVSVLYLGLCLCLLGSCVASWSWLGFCLCLYPCLCLSLPRRAPVPSCILPTFPCILSLSSPRLFLLLSPVSLSLHIFPSLYLARTAAEHALRTRPPGPTRPTASCAAPARRPPLRACL